MSNIFNIFWAKKKKQGGKTKWKSKLLHIHMS